MNEIITQSDKIKNMIYVIREKEVMLDSDLAKLYGCKNGTKEISQAVKNNTEKFPERFSWKLTDEESHNFLVKNFDQKRELRGGKYKNPRVFTEQGVAMLATILKSNIATQISIAIMDAFVAMRHFINDNKDIYVSLNNINNKLQEHDLMFEKVFANFKKETNEILFLNGEVYDAYSKLMDIINEAKEELIIVDGYADKSVLDMISKVKVKIILIVKINTLLKEIDIKKYNEQYHNLKIVFDDSFHDRYIILDRRTIYHCGASLNKAGNKTFNINKLNDKEVKISLLNKIKSLKT